MVSLAILDRCPDPQDGSWILHVHLVDFGNLIFEVGGIHCPGKWFSLIEMN